MDFIAGIFSFILQPYVWIPVSALLFFLAWKNNKKAVDIEKIESTLLMLEIPRNNKGDVKSAEHLFESFHGMLRNGQELRENQGIQEHISLEIVSEKGHIKFYIWTPTSLRSFVESQVYSHFPDIQIYTAPEDYTKRQKQYSNVKVSDWHLANSEQNSLKTASEFQTDSLTTLTETMARLEDSDEEIWIQVLVRPINDDQWKNKQQKQFFGTYLQAVGKSLFSLLMAVWQVPTNQQSVASANDANTKLKKAGFCTAIRTVVLTDNIQTTKLRSQSLNSTIKQFNSANNSLSIKKESYLKEDLTSFRTRNFAHRGFVLNTEELATIFHLPNKNIKTPNVVWSNSQNVEPPSNLPIITGNIAVDENISAFGLTNFRGIQNQFGMLHSDRSRHVYVVGQTGTGKTGLLELFTLSDIYHNHGYAIIDPHGDFATSNIKFIPASRLKDVVYFNPADTAFPLGFNPLELSNPELKNSVSSELIGVFKRMFGNSWGPRLEYILRYTILALLDKPNATMLDIMPMLTNKAFRESVLKHTQDPMVLQFWKVEFESWSDRFISEAISPVLNKVGAFTQNPIIRNIIGQPKSTFNIRKIMDEGKILIVNLSKGLIGEDNASTLGALMVTKIQLAAMSRSNISDATKRRPFYLYVDEFQNFATDSFATILSEARKYGLNLTVANQYTSQMNQNVRDAVFGNVGTMISFRVSADDANTLEKQFSPQFSNQDLLSLNNRDFAINMMIQGEKVIPFSARTLNLPTPQADLTQHIIQNTRQNHSSSRQTVEQNLNVTLKSTLEMLENQNVNYKVVKRSYQDQTKETEVVHQIHSVKISHKNEEGSSESSKKDNDQPETKSSRKRRSRKRSSR